MEFLESTLFGGPLGNGRGEGEWEGEGDHAPSWNDRYRPQLHLFKAQLHLLHLNVKACKKELKSFINAAGNVRTMASIC